MGPTELQLSYFVGNLGTLCGFCCRGKEEEACSEHQQERDNELL